MSTNLSLMSNRQTQKFAWLAADWLMVGWVCFWYWLIWLFGASEWQMIVLAGGGIVGWVIGNLWAKLRLKTTKGLISHSFDPSWIFTDISLKWWLIWFGCLSLVTFFSQIWTVSWLQLQWWVAALSWFWWLGSIRPFQLARLVVFKSLLIGVLSAILGGWAIGSWQPAWASSLASLTYILPSYGHNHVGALIVLIWPFVWTRAVNLKDWRWVAALLVLVIGLVMSLSRTALLAVGLQTLIWWWLKSAELSIYKIRIWKPILVSLLLIFFLTVMVKFTAGWLSLNSTTLKLCYSWWSPPDLCRFSMSEPRWIYWQQALTVWQNFPIFGSGPGTFGLVVRRWFLLETHQSAFVHQAVLQQLAETGLVGLASWGALVFHWLKRFWLNSKKIPGTLGWRLAVMGGLIVGVFDFDWSQAGFWWPFMALVVTWLSTEFAGEQASLNLKIKKILSKKLVLASQISMVGLLSVMVVTSLLGGVWLIKPDRFESLKNWWLVWPMQAEWYPKAISRFQNNETLLDYVLKFAPNHPDLVLAGSSAAQDYSQQYKFLNLLWFLDPIKYWDKNHLYIASGRNDWAQMEIAAERLEIFLTEERKFWRNTQNENYIEGLINLANYEFQNNDYAKGVRALLLAQSLEVWAMHIRPIYFELFATIPSNQPVADLVELAKIDQSRLGENIGSYLSWYHSLTTQALSELKSDPAYQDWLVDTGQAKPTLKAPKILAWTNKIDQLVRVFPILFPQQVDYLAWQAEELEVLSLKAEIAKLKFDPIYLKCETNLYLVDLPLKCDGITNWAVRVRQTAEKFLGYYPDELIRPDPESEQIASLVIAAGDATVGHKLYQVASYYQLAQEINPWVMNNRLWWFEILDPIYQPPDIEEFLLFADTWQHFSGDKGGHKPAAWLTFYTKMLEQADEMGSESRRKNYEAKLKIIQANLD